jgi:hypothetical protein
MPWPRPLRGRLALVVGTLPALACCLILGCTGGPKRYRVSGKVTFAGKPVPAGTIYFTPDGARNNRGPAGYAQIKDGQYDTSASGGQGATAGPVVVKIEGSDGTNQLFRTQELPADLPQENTSKDFDVPAEAGQGLPKSAGPAP